MATRVAVDAMGGDDAPGVVIEGAIQAAREEPGRMHLIFFGPEELVRVEVGKHDTEGLGVDVVDAPEVIGMGESPSAALKTKPNSSIHLGLGAVKQSHADAFVSAGNTGAVMAGALFICGRLPGVHRPSLPGYFPTPTGTAIVVDVGANVDVKPEHLLQFAHMGCIFAERVFGVDNPSVALVNVGEERGKGTEVVKEAYNLLESAEDLNFIGNVEGRDLFNHKTDVAVCDGFVGNALLKLGESFATVLPKMIRNEIGKQGLDEAQAQIVGRVLKGALAPFNYENFGAVPLLGVDGNVLVGHGGSTARAVEQMMYRACEVVEQNLAGSIAAALAE